MILIWLQFRQDSYTKAQARMKAKALAPKLFGTILPSNSVPPEPAGVFDEKDSGIVSYDFVVKTKHDRKALMLKLNDLKAEGQLKNMGWKLR